MQFELQDNLSVRVAQWIENQIVTGEFRPNYRVREEQIAAKTGVSRGPIREALLILQRQRLIEIMPRRGAVVTRLSEQQIKELFDVVTSLFTLVAINLLENVTPEAMASIDDHLATLEKFAIKNDHVNYLKSSRDFLMFCYQQANNKLLENMLNDLMPSVHRVQYLSIQRRRYDLKKNFDSLHRVYKYIKKRDIDRVKKSIISHNQQEQKYALDALLNTAEIVD